jgi:acetyl esterase
MLERIADNTGQAVVGAEYRLAPEHPYLAGPAAAWLVQNGKKEFGTDALTGRSADRSIAGLSFYDWFSNARHLGAR